jgi:hypothetical protein
MKIALQRREKLALSFALAAGIALGFGVDAARDRRPPS